MQEHKTPAHTEFAALSAQYRVYLDRVRRIWFQANRHRSNKVYEIMEPWEQEQVHQINDRWAKYVTPLAEAWWKERGWGVIWPPNNSEPMKVFKLEAA